MKGDWEAASPEQSFTGSLGMGMIPTLCKPAIGHSDYLQQKMQSPHFDDVPWQHAIMSLNNLTNAPIASLYRRIALASCCSVPAGNARNWA